MYVFTARYKKTESVATKMHAFQRICHIFLFSSAKHWALLFGSLGFHEVFVLSGFYCKAHCSNDVLSPQCSLHFTQCEIRRQIICSYLSLVNSWLPLAQFVYLEKIWCKKMQAGNFLEKYEWSYLFLLMFVFWFGRCLQSFHSKSNLDFNTRDLSLCHVKWFLVTWGKLYIHEPIKLPITDFQFVLTF